MTETKTKHIAEAVMRLSDYFIENPDGRTPWEENWAQTAYKHYFLPLNTARNKRAIDHGVKQDFFKGLTKVIDFGSGLGAATTALIEKNIPINNFIHIERSPIAIKLHQELLNSKNNHHWVYELDSNPGQDTMVIFSCSFTELQTLPIWSYEAEALMILEPSTMDDGRRLLQLRNKLIEHGFYIWAPCTHQLPCPLLTHSKTDWCHDRVAFQGNKNFEDLEKLLPIKNKTLTLSYLLARKTPPPAKTSQARLIGDFLVEKGKTRQLVCRGEKREYLAWLDRDKIAQPELHRGELIDWPKAVTEKANEIRLKEIVEVSKF